MLDQARVSVGDLILAFGMCTPAKVCVVNLALGSTSRVNSVCLLFNVVKYVT